MEAVFEGERNPLKQAFEDYQISPIFQEHFLMGMNGIEFGLYILLDDSTSMTLSSDAAGFDSRWEEGVSMVYSIFGLARHFVPVYFGFVNSRGFYEVKDQNTLRSLCAKKPFGSTPLHIQFEELNKIDRRKLIICITDGEPDSWSRFCEAINGRNPETNRISFVMCADDRTVERYHKILDDEADFVDVVDDIEKERKKVRLAQGNILYTIGDQIVRCILALLYDEYDQITKKKIDAISTDRKALSKRISLESKITRLHDVIYTHGSAIPDPPKPDPPKPAVKQTTEPIEFEKSGCCVIL